MSGWGTIRAETSPMPIPALTRTRVAALALLTGASALASLSAQTPDPMIQDLRWRNVGNANLVGRISSIDALDSDWAHVIVGSAAGGVFKSVSGGVAWEPTFDKYGAASIGD